MRTRVRSWQRRGRRGANAGVRDEGGAFRHPSSRNPLLTNARRGWAGTLDLAKRLHLELRQVNLIRAETLVTRRRAGHRRTASSIDTPCNFYALADDGLELVVRDLLELERLGHRRGGGCGCGWWRRAGRADRCG